MNYLNYFKSELKNCTFHAGVYVDWLNIKMNGGRDLHFAKLLGYIRDQGGFVRVANFYAPKADDQQITFYDAVRKSGFRILTIRPKSHDATSVDADVMLAVDMVAQGTHLDVVYLLTHDSDFIPAVRYLQSKAIRVVLLHADKPSNELRDIVDEWRHLAQLELL